MRKILVHVVIGGMLFGNVACDDHKDTVPEILPSEQGVFVDQRDNQEYRWVRYGQLEWMAENMRVEVSEGVSRIFSDELITKEEKALQEIRNYEKYGYLYDHEAAKSAVPDGWRLPTDADWQNLEKYFGMPENQVATMGWRGEVQGEMMQGKNMLALKPGGLINYENHEGVRVSYTPEFLGFYGFFWTSTGSDSDSGESAFIYRQIRYNSGEMGRFSTLSKKMMSVRCVRDVTKNNEN